jgi:hypothetical protein
VPTISESALSPGDYLLVNMYEPDGRGYMAVLDQTGHVVGVLGPAISGASVAHSHFVVAYTFPFETRSEIRGIFILDLASGETTEVPNTPECVTPAWSPDDSLLATSCPREDHAEARVISPSGDLIGVVSDCRPPMGCGGLAWSPSGDAIAYRVGIIRSGPHPLPGEGIYWVETSCLLEPSECPSLTHGPIPEVDPFTWGPGPQQIAIARDSRIDVIDLTTGNTDRSLPTTWVGVASLAWSPDGATIAYEASGNIHLVVADTGRDVVIQGPMGYEMIGWIAWRQSGSTGSP